MLSWEEIGHLRSSGVEIGSHGVDHEIHHVNQPQAVRWFELTRSKTVLEEKFAGPCRFFAYPNGDFVETSVEEVRSAGYDLAFTTESGVANAHTNPYLLPRINPPELFTS
jgi:peptidoglycan/xylan/chitin deacetylase (PgdA/CDA1 family)